MTNKTQGNRNSKKGEFVTAECLVSRARAIRVMVAFPLLAILALGVASAKGLPDAPSVVASATTHVINGEPAPIKIQRQEAKPVDAKFLALAIISTGSTFADSYTTLFARQNWIAGKTGVCNVEVQSAYLYGTHPAVGRAYAVASVKSLSSFAAAYYLRKHRARFWMTPLLANSVISLQGVRQNMIECN